MYQDAGNAAPQRGNPKIKQAINLAFSAAIALLAAGFIFWQTTRGKIPAEPYVRRFPVMGTVCELKFWESPDLAAKAADEAAAAIREVEGICNIFDKESEIARLNAGAFEKPFKCGPLLWDVLSHARRFNTISEGSFDIAVKPLMILWGFYRKRGELPARPEIEKALKTVGMDKIAFDDKERTVKFLVDGMGLDLGGVAKGYALDVAADRVLKLGARRGIINLGGNMRCLPLPPPGRDAYLVGVRDPFDKDAIIGEIKLLNCCVGTSGDYERYVVIDGRHYTHIMDPKTGLPVENMLSVSVVTPLGVESDGLSKYPFIRGPEAAKILCERIPNTSILVIRRDPRNPEKIVMDAFGSIWKGVATPEPPAREAKKPQAPLK